MALFEPTVQPTNVGPSGIVVAVSIPYRYRGARLSRVVVQHASGSLDSYGVIVSTDQLCVDTLRRIASFEDNVSLSRVDDDNTGAGFAHDLEDRDNFTTGPKDVFVKITPSKGTDNNFNIGIYAEPGR